MAKKSIGMKVKEKLAGSKWTIEIYFSDEKPGGDIVLSFTKDGKPSNTIIGFAVLSTVFGHLAGQVLREKNPDGTLLSRLSRMAAECADTWDQLERLASAEMN